MIIPHQNLNCVRRLKRRNFDEFLRTQRSQLAGTSGRTPATTDYNKFDTNTTTLPLLDNIFSSYLPFDVQLSNILPEPHRPVPICGTGLLETYKRDRLMNNERFRRCYYYSSKVPTVGGDDRCSPTTLVMMIRSAKWTVAHHRHCHRHGEEERELRSESHDHFFHPEECRRTWLLFSQLFSPFPCGTTMHFY
jgi:hypothetical protein